MPQSDLAKMIQNTDGKIVLGTAIDYSGVFEVLGNDHEQRISLIGEGQEAAKINTSGQGQQSENELSNITFAIDGIWLKDDKLKMVALGLVLYGNSPYKRDSDIIIALDPNKSNNDLSAQGIVGNSASFPRKLDDDTILAMENRVQSKDVRAGLCVSRELFKEYYTRFFPNDNFSSSKDSDFDNLVSQGLLWAEVLWKTSESGGSVFKFPVLGEYVLPSSSKAMLKFPACLTAIPEYQNAGVKLFVDGTQIYDGNDTEPIMQLNYDWRTGRTGVTLDSLRQLDAEIDAKEYTQLSNQVVYVRFFSQDEAKVQSALGHKLHKDFFKTNGQDAAYQVKRVVAFSGGESTLTGQADQDTINYETGQVNWNLMIQHYGNRWGQVAEAIENQCREFNINVRAYISQLSQECGPDIGSKNFKDRNNPGGLSWAWKSTQDRTYRGVHVRRESALRGEGYGNYMIFDTIDDGIHVMLSLLSEKYRKNAQTVGEFYHNLAIGGYCDVKENSHYDRDLKNMYKRISNKLSQ